MLSQDYMLSPLDLEENLMIDKIWGTPKSQHILYIKYGEPQHHHTRKQNLEMQWYYKKRRGKLSTLKTGKSPKGRNNIPAELFIWWTRNR